MNRITRPLTFLAAVLTTLALFGAAPATADLSYSTFIHVASADTLFFNSTTLDHPKLNGNPGAKVFVTERRNVFDPSTVGVWYNGTNWLIFNEDLSNMVANRMFHVMVFEDASDAFTHTATVSNIFGAATELDHPELNDNPDALFLITPNFEPFDVYNDNNTGLLYTSGRWRIFNENLVENMPEGASFNVLILNQEADAYAHTLVSTGLSCARLDSLSYTENSVFLTHRWASGTALSDHPFQIDATAFATGAPMGICTSDGLVMPDNAQYVVFPAAIFTDGFESADSTAWSNTVG